jgi:hypothetical protein
MRQVEALMEVLLQNNKVRAATHNIMAYRIEQPERGTFLQVGAFLPARRWTAWRPKPEAHQAGVLSLL